MRALHGRPRRHHHLGLPVFPRPPALPHVRPTLGTARVRWLPHLSLSLSLSLSLCVCVCVCVFVCVCVCMCVWRACVRVGSGRTGISHLEVASFLAADEKLSSLPIPKHAESSTTYRPLFNTAKAQVM